MKARALLSPGRALALAAAFSAGAVAVSPGFGSVDLDMVKAFGDWLGSWGTAKADWSVEARILALRIPRIALAWLAGGASLSLRTMSTTRSRSTNRFPASPCSRI